jgi:hypothetical protein
MLPCPGTRLALRSGGYPALKKWVTYSGAGRCSCSSDNTSPISRQLVAAVIRVLVKYGRQEEKNLLAVRDVICGDVFAFARRYVNCGDSAVRQALGRYTTKFAEESRTAGLITKSPQFRAREASAASGGFVHW